MKITVRSVGNISVLDLSGKITIGEGDIALRDEIQKLVNSGRTQLLLNMDKVTYVDSAGIGEIISAYKRARDKGATVKILKPSGRVADLLHLTRLQEVFETFEDEKEALASF